MTARRRALLWWVAVLGCALCGLVLRTYNLDFDQRQHLHPDERHWSLTSSALDGAPAPPDHGTALGPVLDWLDGKRSPANAYRGADTFVYGPVTLAATRGVAGWLHDGAIDGRQPASTVVSSIDRLGVPLLDDANAPRFDDAYEVDLIGRLLGALADAVTIVVVALIGRRLGGRWVGLAAALFAAFSVLAIQHAHYFGSEPLLALTAALTVLATLHIDVRGSIRPALWTGAVAGLAAGATLAVKLSGAGLAVVPVAACAWLLLTRRKRADVVRLAAVLAGIAMAFRVLYPSAFDGLGIDLSSTFLDDLRQTNEANGAGLPPSFQWAGRIPIVEPLRWLVTYTIGPAASVAAAIGTVVLFRRRHELGMWTAWVAAASWLVPLVFVLRQSVTTQRYFVPMLPALWACAGFGLVAAVRFGLGRRDAIGRVVLGASGVAVVLCVAWGAAFVAGVHGDTHTRIAASAWIDENVPAGSVLTAESWDDGLPLAVNGVEPTNYEFEQLDLVGTDSVEKVDLLAETLQDVDYVVESSPRIWRSVVRLPARFPSTIRFFETLDSGALGFDRVATFTSPPQLGWWRLDEGGAEEAFSVYDHPEVRVWQRVRDVSADDMVRQLDPVGAAAAITLPPEEGRANGAMLPPNERAANAAMGTFDDDFDTGANPIGQAVGWFLVVELLGLSAFVVFAPVLRPLPDAGAGLAITLGLAVTTFVVFVLVAWAGAPLTRGLVAGVVAVWLVGGALAGYRQRAVLGELWAQRRRAIVQAQALVAAAFVAVLVLRSANPDLWHAYRGGEKLFELEMFTAVLRTRTLPPYDPWFAGGTLNYYYGGYLVLSIPARLLGTAPALAFNLGMALVVSMAVGAASSAGSAVADAWRKGRGAPDDGQNRVVRAAGLVAVVFVLALPSAAIVAPVVGRFAGRESGALDWWGLSRLIPNSPVVTEFPAWSILFGDLHPHVIDLPILLTTLVVVLGWYRSLLTADSWRPPVLLAALVATLLGLVQATNTWDLPLAAGLAVVVPVAAAIAKAPWRRCVAAIATAAAVALVGWAPYAWRTVVTDAGLERESLYTPFLSWLEHFGFFAVCTTVIVGLVVIRAWPSRPAPDKSSATVRRRAMGRWVALLATMAVVVVAVAAIAEPSRAVALTALALAAASAAGAVIGYRATHVSEGERTMPAVVLALAASSVAWGLVAVIEVFSVTNDFDRQNTVFKGWYQAWILLAVGSAAALVVLGAGALRARAASSPTRLGDRLMLAAVGALAVVAVLMTTAFAQLAAPARLDDRVSRGGPSLDSLAFLQSDDIVPSEATYDPGDDRALIEWLQANVRSNPTIAEATGDDYGWNGRVAALTGLPSVVGWPYHQSQQRRDQEAAVRTRVGDLSELYRSGDEDVIAAVLERYGIDYVVFGSVENQIASRSSREALLTSRCLDVAFAHDESFISRVDRECLADRNETASSVEG